MTGVDVDMISTGILLLATTGIAVCGVAGIATGWVLPWLRFRILRPRLWGYGTLVSAAGGMVWTLLGPINGTRHLPSAYVDRADWILFVAGLLIQHRSQRHGRAPGDATKASS
ncbi:hypothetical protein OHT57_32535 [Streptomyces sp. NBC_00285]|uniref:hypothetical protein n=1 Tax=Streptomyces sp. NBC_00285 TaxID=2975700 RepID=UPI002E2ADCFC|nr:hypothetical protein [Streptomyces sp. NBC_00285]